MKTTLLLSLVLVVGAVAGCATPDNESDPTPTTSTPTPATTTPVTTPATPTPGDEGPPAPDPRCLAPPPASLANLTSSESSTRLGMPELRFTTSDESEADPCYRFHGPLNATSGWNVFTLSYPAGGRTFHIMPMYFVANRTAQDLAAGFGPNGEAPEWATPSGAVGGVTPGSNGSVAIDLQPGNYVYFCPIEGHMFKGMMGTLTVTQAENESAEPTADAAIQLVDYNFTVPATLAANVSVIKVTNNGSEPHEAPLVLLQGNATAMEFLNAIEDPNATGPPPGSIVGGVNAIAPGQTVYILRDLAADERYAMACFVSSPSHGGAPHLALGMVKEFSVA